MRCFVTSGPELELALFDEHITSAPMPELPEVETVGRGLSPVMVGERFSEVELRRPDLRFPFPPDFKQRIEGRMLVSLERRAKFLIATLDSGDALTLHLGMSGRFTIHRPNDPSRAPGDFVHDPGTDPTHDHVVFHMSNGVTIVFNDPRRFGFMELYTVAELATAPRFADLGPEPLGNQFTPDALSAALTGKRTPIKAALLDQRVVAGLGNIYVCEALFRSGISPRRSAHTVAGKRAERLVPHIRDVLREAIASGGSSLRDYAQTDGALGYFQHNFAVYGREGQPCVTCGAPVQRITQSGRSTFFCGPCQR